MNKFALAFEDEYRIRSLLTDFARLADESPNVEAVAALFTANASWRMGDDPWLGREAIAAGLRSLRVGGAVGPGSRTRHILTNIAICAVAASVAQAHSCFLLIGAAPKPAIIVSGQYEDQVVREADAWRIDSRRVILD